VAEGPRRPAEAPEPAGIRDARQIPNKLFFRIGEAARLTGVQAHVLRYWEAEFPMLHPKKSGAGQRLYRRRDIETILRIRDLLYQERYTIAGAKRRLADEEETAVAHAREVLGRVKAGLEDIAAFLKRAP
jgi:DNA-binding transcriptional MerR regulator